MAVDWEDDKVKPFDWKRALVRLAVAGYLMGGCGSLVYFSAQDAAALAAWEEMRERQSMPDAVSNAKISGRPLMNLTRSIFWPVSATYELGEQIGRRWK